MHSTFWHLLRFNAELDFQENTYVNVLNENVDDVHPVRVKDLIFCPTLESSPTCGEQDGGCPDLKLAPVSFKVAAR